MNSTPEQLEGFTRKRLLAVLSTVTPDGSPQATPLWYLYDGGHFKFTSHGGRVKVRNIRRDPRVTLVVVDTSGYGQHLIVRGATEVIEEGGEVFAHTMARRYQGETKGKAGAEELVAYARGIGQPRVVIQVAPEKIIFGA